LIASKGLKEKIFWMEKECTQSHRAVVTDTLVSQ